MVIPPEHARLLLSLGSLLASCAEPQLEEIRLGADPACDALDEGHCLLPWPSDRYLVEDASTATGYRLAYDPAAFPDNRDGEPFDPAPWSRLDGAPPSGQILATFAAAPDLADAAFHDNIERSLEPDHPTVLLDLASGERLAHWVELDAQHEGEGPQLVFLRVTERLQADHPYAVAFRALVDAEGQPLPPSEAFRALRDELPTDDDATEARRASYEEMFGALEQAGVERQGLTAAWRFHTASDASLRGDLLHMREDALARLGPDGIGCTITEEIDRFGKGSELESYRWVRGSITVPSYMDHPKPPARLARDDADRPVYVEDVEVEFSAVLPHSLAEEPRSGRFITYGHGLMGEHESYTQGQTLRESAEAIEAVIAATNWAGMSEEDVAATTDILLNISRFPILSDRLHQAMINQIALTRTLAGVCRDHPALSAGKTPLIDPTERYFVGGSQGGILGATLLAIHPDIQRGVLFVHGMSFPFTMERSIDFVPFLPVFETGYPDRLDRALLLSIVQHLWDTAEPSSWLPALLPGLEGIGPKTVLSVAAHNDAQVPNLSTDLAVRTAGLPVLSGSSREPWGLDVVDPATVNSGAITIDLGDRAVPEENLAADFNDGGHSAVGGVESVVKLVDHFLRPEGELLVDCEGICDPN